ncbi:hypothetical protein cypCar_00006703, partial [Cyprinus carpio]
MVGLVYMFNLIVGTGALTMPKAFAAAGWVVSVSLITFLAFMRYVHNENMSPGESYECLDETGWSCISVKQQRKEPRQQWSLNTDFLTLLSSLSFMTTTFVIEAMAAANAQLRWKRREQEEINDSDSSSDYSDDEVVIRGRSEPVETRPILSVQRAVNVDHFDIVERVELGQMASMFFNKVGVNMFYICLIVYLYGDLAIYAAAVPVSLMEVACGNHSCSAGSVKYNDTDSCWGPVRRKDAYRVFLVSTAAPVTNTNCQTQAPRWQHFCLGRVLDSNQLKAE